MLIIPEWVYLLSFAFCTGFILSRLVFFTPSMEDRFSYKGNLVPHMWNWFCLALAAILLGGLVELLFRTAEISGEPFPVFLHVMPTVVFHSHYGLVWMIRIAALLLLACAKAAVRYRDTRVFLIFSLAMLVVVSFTQSASGHASDKGDFSIPEVIDWIHLAGASIWGGGLMALSAFILPEVMINNQSAGGLIAMSAARFSAVAGVAVGMVLITAVYNFWFYIGSMQALSTPYAIIVIAKSILLIVLLCLGAVNRYVNVPLMSAFQGGSAGRQDLRPGIGAGLFRRWKDDDFVTVSTRLKKSVKWETLVMIAVFLCVAFLRHEVPAKHYMHLKHFGGTGRSGGSAPHMH